MIRLWCSLFHRKHHHRVGRVSMECSWCGRLWKRKTRRDRGFVQQGGEVG